MFYFKEFLFENFSEFLKKSIFFKKNRTAVKQRGWFTTSASTEDEITEERKYVTPRSTRLTPP